MNHRRIRTAAAVAVLGFALSACATWSSATVTPPPGGSAVTAATAAPRGAPAGAAMAAARPAPDPSQIMLTTVDVTDRPYDVLGDIEVTVNKTTLFHPDPTPAHVDAKLREEAAALGADAVVLVTYGTVGMSWWSYGALDGSGRAVRWK